MRLRSRTTDRLAHLRLSCLAVFFLAPAALAKSPPVSEYDLEASLRSAALVVAVRVTDAREMRVMFGGKMSETIHEYTFEPIRILKGVYARPQLQITSSDLRSYSIVFDPDDIRRGQQRLLLLGRSNVGYRGIHYGSTADTAFPPVSGPEDPLLAAAETLLEQQALRDRQAVVSGLARRLGDVEGRGSMVLLSAIERRAYVAAQDVAAFAAIRQQLAAPDAEVRRVASRVLGRLLDADYLRNDAIRRDAVADLVTALQREETSLGARLAAWQALVPAIDAVRNNDDAVRLVSLDAPYDTLAERSARLDVFGRLHEGQGVAAAALRAWLDDLPLDARDGLQRSSAEAIARITPSAAEGALFDRIRRKKALGLEATAEIGAFAVLFESVSDPWPLQRRLLERRLTLAERQAFVRACEHKPAPQLVTVLAEMLDPRNEQLRRLAADLLMEIDTKAAAEALRAQLAAEPDLGYKLRLAAFIGHHGYDDGYRYAIEHLSEPRYLEAAVDAVAAIGKSGTARQLLDIYRTSNDLAWQRAAVRGLGRIGHAAFAAELDTLTRGLTHPLAAPALLARADLGDAKVAPLLPGALSSRNEAVVVAAARASGVLLSRTGAESQDRAQLRAALAALAGDPEAGPGIRAHALEALVAAGDPRLDEVLVGLIRDAGIERSESLTRRVRELLREWQVRM